MLLSYNFLFLGYVVMYTFLNVIYIFCFTTSTNDACSPDINKEGYPILTSSASSSIRGFSERLFAILENIINTFDK